MTVATPALTAATAPVVVPMVNIVVLLLAHIPPDVASLKIVLLQITVLPVIGEGSATTVMGTLAEHPRAVV